MPVFQISNQKLKQLNSKELGKEKVLQKLIEDSLEVLDINFLATEYITTTGDKIDTLAIDSNGKPVIIEYKRNQNDNVITQALYYLDWLQSQNVGFFKLLVIEKLGTEKATRIDWKNPRVICIAQSYHKYDIKALNRISPNLELYRYNYYENDIFTLENVKGDVEKPKYVESVTPEKEAGTVESGLESHLKKAQPFVKEIFFSLKQRIFELDENIEEKVNNYYIAYKISKIFAEVHIQKSKLLIYLRPKIVYADPEKRIDKVPDSYNWVLNHRVYINNIEDIDYVMPLIEQSYKDVL